MTWWRERLKTIHGAREEGQSLVVAIVMVAAVELAALIFGRGER